MIDKTYALAVGLVLTNNRASTSFIQRHLAVSYQDATSLINRMETDGFIAAPNTVGKREVLLPVKPEVAA